MDAGVNLLIASGYTGQTTENFYPQTVILRSGGRSHPLVGQRKPHLSVRTLDPSPRHDSPKAATPTEVGWRLCVNAEYLPNWEV
jgi:hypothetical protein